GVAPLNAAERHAVAGREQRAGGIADSERPIVLAGLGREFSSPFGGFGCQASGDFELLLGNVALLARVGDHVIEGSARHGLLSLPAPSIKTELLRAETEMAIVKGHNRAVGPVRGRTGEQGLEAEAIELLV